MYYPNVQVTLLLLMTILLNCIFRCTDYVDKFSIETLPSHFTSWFSNGCNNNLHAKIQDLLQKCHINKIFVQKRGIFNINSNRARLQKWKNKTKKNQKKSEKSKKKNSFNKLFWAMTRRTKLFSQCNFVRFKNLVYILWDS